MKHKEIKLLPSQWTMDVVECAKEDFERLDIWMHKRYGLPTCELVGQNINAVHSIKSSSKSILKGKKLILLAVNDLNDDGVLVHELIHALWYHAEHVGYEMHYETQEWQAIMFEYMFNEIKDKKGWKKVPLKCTRL
jgi:hypothetical protein